MRGADALIAGLEREGVRTVFGVPGGAILPVYDALRDSPIRHVLVRHEASAGHAAEGWAKATGEVGVALATSGPGATNLITAIADAQMDSVPTVFICGQVSTAVRGTMAFQEADVVGMTMPLVKHAFAIERADDIAQAVADAFHVARSGRPGPVLIDLPSDIARAPARDRPADPPAIAGVRSRAKPRAAQVVRAAEAIAKARRPILYAGGGVVHSGAQAELVALARAGDLPVTTTLMALGAFPASDGRWLGMLGMHGTRPANWAIDEADLIVAVGARFDDRVTGKVDEFARGARIVHIDIDTSEIDKVMRADLPIVADAKLALGALVGALAALEPDPRRLAAWWERIDGWRAEHPLDPEPRGSGEAVLDALREALHADAIVTTDVGQHQMWAANRLRFERPRRWLTSGGLGTMGFGIGAALGAQAAEPDATVVCVTGDGSLMMHVQELITAASERLPIKLLLLDNRALGMVRQQQDLFWDGRRAEIALDGPDWEGLARACGCAVHHADEPDAVAAWLAEPGPALLHAPVALEADCLPMFQPGTAAREMIG